jgi:ubiquinone/menaquinone biosynthesis C-methylase UbiE
MADPDHLSSTRDAYDATADLYAARIGTEITAAVEAPLDRAMLSVFVELAGDGAVVADLGCGPGRVAAFLAATGLDVIGVDLSPAMLTIARSAHPGIRFEEGRLTELPLANRTMAGAVCWYSIIHSPPEELGSICHELRRVVISGGHLLIAFQSGGGEAVHRSQIQDRDVSLTNYRHDPDVVARSLTEHSFDVTARVVREPAAPHESTPQAFLFARARSVGLTP